jgi:hypothetical protein
LELHWHEDEDKTVAGRRIVMGDVARWGAVLAAVLLLFGLAAYARGPEHRRGDDIGSHGTKVVIVRTEAR